MVKYWYEKRMWGLSPVLWPVTWHGWLFQPAVIWLLILATGFWLVSYAPETWQDGLGLVVLFSAFAVTIGALFLKTDPGPGWCAGWEKERRLVSRFPWLSAILYLAGGAAGLWFLATQPYPAFGILFLCAYQSLAIALLYKVAAKDGGEPQSEASLSSTDGRISRDSVAGLSAE